MSTQSERLSLPDLNLGKREYRVVGIPSAQFTQYLNLANTEFYEYYADKSIVPRPTHLTDHTYCEPLPGNLYDEFDANGQRFCIVRVNDQGTVVAGISVVVANDPDQQLDVEKYFALPLDQSQHPRFSIGRLTLNHDLILNNEAGHVAATQLYQDLHLQAVELIKRLAQDRPYTIWAVVSNKTHGFVEKSDIGIHHTPQGQLLDNDTTHYLQSHYPLYWRDDNPHLVTLDGPLTTPQKLEQRQQLDRRTKQPFADLTDPEGKSIRQLWQESPRRLWQVLGHITPEPLAQAAISLIAQNEADALCADIEKYLKKEIRQRIFIKLNGQDVSLDDWYKQYAYGWQTNRGKQSAYAEIEGKFVRVLPKEVMILLAMLANVEASTTEKYVEQFNRYLKLSRRSPTVAIAGMSVGGEIMLGLLQRFPFLNVHIADPKGVNYVNSNRFSPYSLSHNGQSKVKLRQQAVAARLPWIKVTEFPEGITEENAPLFLYDVQCVYDEVDDGTRKPEIRRQARKANVDLFMYSDLNPTVLAEFRPFGKSKWRQPIPLFALCGDSEVNTLMEQAKSAQQNGNPTAAARAFQELVMKVTGPTNISPQFGAHLALFGKGDIHSISQPTELIRTATAVAIKQMEQYWSGKPVAELTRFSLTGETLETKRD